MVVPIQHEAVMRRFFQCQLLLLLLVFAVAPAVFAGGKAFSIEVTGAIGPVSQDLIVRALERANAESAQLVVLEMNTPGGLDHSMRQIISAILASRVPVVTWVTPQGARAASAGTYILYASHVAAMSPATNLGAATPVSLGGVPGFSEKKGDGTDSGSSGKSPSSMMKKVINDATAYIKGLAELRGRNEAWAEQAVREAVSLTATEALELNVIDLIAHDRDDLFRQLDGREIPINNGRLTLATSDLTVEVVQPDWRSRLLSIITDPNIAYFLLLAGIYGLFIEFAHPGYILPGVAGSISLLLALYAFQILPVNYTGLLLVALGLGFIVAEVFITSAGILGAGGVIAFVVGSIILFDDPHLGVSIPLISSVALIAAGFLLWLLGRIVSIRRKKVMTGKEYMIGLEAEAIEDIDQRGRVRVEGENWLAESDTPIKVGQKVRIDSVDHLVVKVSPLEET